MEKIRLKYKIHFTDKTFITSICVGLLFLIISLVANFYAGTYATAQASSPVNDIILSNTRVYDVDALFIYAPLLLWLFVGGLCMVDPKKAPFILKSIAAFVLIRSVFVILTHIGPFPNQALAGLSTSEWAGKFIFGGDLFFSAHTGLPFLMALAFWDTRWLRYLFIATAVFFGAIVLLGHLHYSIDVLSAFFITYSIFRISEIIFSKEKKLFDESPLLISPTAPVLQRSE
jgi:hypothetical protein